MTTQQTTYRFGALGNSGLGSTEEHGFPSGKGRKKPFSAESAIINAFGTIRPQVRSLSLGPKTTILIEDRRFSFVLFSLAAPPAFIFARCATGPG